MVYFSDEYSNDENISTQLLEDELLDYEDTTQEKEEIPNNCYTINKFCAEKAKLINIINQIKKSENTENKPFRVHCTRAGMWVMIDNKLVMKIEDTKKVITTEKVTFSGFFQYKGQP